MEKHKHIHKQTKKKITKKWIGIDPESKQTYVLKNFVSDIDQNSIKADYKIIKTISDLYMNHNIINHIEFSESPTSCYFSEEPIIVNNKQYFYFDQQNLVKWYYLTDDKHIYAEFDNNVYMVANSISDFLTLMDKENHYVYAQLLSKLDV